MPQTTGLRLPKRRQVGGQRLYFGINKLCAARKTDRTQKLQMLTCQKVINHRTYGVNSGSVRIKE